MSTIFNKMDGLIRMIISDGVSDTYRLGDIYYMQAAAQATVYTSTNLLLRYKYWYIIWLTRTHECACSERVVREKERGRGGRRFYFKRPFRCVPVYIIICITYLYNNIYINIFYFFFLHYHRHIYLAISDHVLVLV